MKPKITLLLFLLATLFSCMGDPLAKMPNFKMVLPDNGGIVFTESLANTAPVMFVHFSPDCKGCQEEAALIKEKISDFSKTRIYFLSIAGWDDIQYFRDYFKLNEHDNVFFGRDSDTVLARHFETVTTPLIALYDRHKNLKAIIEGSSDLERLLNTVKEIQ